MMFEIDQHTVSYKELDKFPFRRVFICPNVDPELDVPTYKIDMGDYSFFTLTNSDDELLYWMKWASRSPNDDPMDDWLNLLSPENVKYRTLSDEFYRDVVDIPHWIVNHHSLGFIGDQTFMYSGDRMEQIEKIFGQLIQYLYHNNSRLAIIGSYILDEENNV